MASLNEIMAIPKVGVLQRRTPRASEFVLWARQGSRWGPRQALFVISGCIRATAPASRKEGRRVRAGAVRAAVVRGSSDEDEAVELDTAFVSVRRSRSRRAAFAKAFTAAVDAVTLGLALFLAYV